MFSAMGESLFDGFGVGILELTAGRETATEVGEGEAVGVGKFFEN